jgi:tetratricopeptide (TPR) repeat protein
MAGNRSLAFGRFLLATFVVLPALPALADDWWDTCRKASGSVAIAACTRAIDSGSFKGQNLAQLYQWRGHQYFKQTQLDRNTDELDRAISDFTGAIELDAKSVGCFTCRCAARLMAGQLPEAVADCNQALRLRPNDGAALQNRGFTYIQLDLFDMALADFDAGLSISPMDPEMLYGRGLAKRKKGDATGANSDIATATRIKADIANEIAKFYGPN